MEAPEWLKRLLDDFKKRQFWALKLLYFLIFGGMFTLYPFITIHARSLGITEQEIGAIYGVMPILGIFAPALAGMLADKLGNFKLLMSITFAIGGLSALIFLAVPRARITYRIPENVPLSLNCSSSQGHSIALIEPYHCNFTENDVDLRIKECNIQCSSSHRLLVPLLQEGDKWCDVTSECRTSGLREESETSDTAGGSAIKIQAKWNPKNDTPLLLLDEEFCPDFDKIYPTVSTYNISDTPTDKAAADTCWLECSSYALRDELCSNNNSTVDVNPSLTFGIYLLVRVFNGITLAMSIPLLEGATIAILKEHDGDFGFQRLYINLGMIVMTPISGFLMDAFSGPFHSDFRPAFFLYCGMNCLSALAILFVDLEFKKPSNNVLRDFTHLIIKPEVVVYLLVNLISGICIGLIDTFLFWLLDDMGADKSLMGITVMVGAIFGIPMLIASAPIIEKLGHVNTICMGMAFYVIRLTGYSLITNPWWAMPFEALECFTVSLLSVACVSYAALLSSPSTMTSLQGMQAGIVHGVGRGTGSLIGGFLSVSLGISRTFQMMSIVCGITVVVYGLINQLIFKRLKRKKKERENESEKERDKESAERAEETYKENPEDKRK